MKRYIYKLCILAVIMMGLTSCLNSDSDSSNVTVYHDTAITAFSISAANRYIHTTSSSGGDSVYVAKLTVANYPFSIDQYQRKIYNNDSLPADCDLKHVLVSVTASSYSGTVFIKGIDNDTLYFYSSTDSVDLSQPREFQVYNSSLEHYRAYTVDLNVRKSANNCFIWEKMPKDCPDVPATIDRAVSLTTGSDGTFQLSLDGGTTWSDEQLGVEEDPANLPVSDFSYLTYALTGDKDMDYHLLVGKFAGNDKICTIFRKITVDGAGKWICLLNYPITDNYPGALPVSSHISLIYHNDQLFAIQEDGTAYESRDYGLSWQKSTKFNLPSGAGTSGLRVAADILYVWLVNKDSGDIWRGYYVND